MRLMLLAALVAVFGGSCLSQDEASGKVALKRAIVEGDVLVLDVESAKGWHFYPANSADANQTAIKITPGPRAIGGDIVEPKPVRHEVVYDGKVIDTLDIHEGAITFRVPLKATGTPGTSIEGSVTITICTDEMCLPPLKIPFKATLPGGGPVARDAAPGAASKPATQDAGTRRVTKNPEPRKPQMVEDPLTVTAIAVPEQVTAGTVFSIAITLEVAKPSHIYGLEAGNDISIPTTLTIGAGADRAKISGEVIPARAPKTHGEGTDAFKYYEGSITFEVPVTVTGAPGAFSFDLKLGYQTCTMESCLAPTNLLFPVTVNVAAGTATPSAVQDSKPTNPAAPPTRGPAPAPPPGPQNQQPTRAAVLTFDTALLEPGQRAVARVRAESPAGKSAPWPESAVIRVALFGGDIEVVGDPTVAIDPDGARNVTVAVRVSDTAKEGTIDLTGEIRAGDLRMPVAGRVEVHSTLIGFLLIAMFSAALALLTPCVFPMIPVTISYFTKQSGEGGTGRALRLGMLYAFGIVASFTLIGFVFTAALGGDGAVVFAQHRVTQGAIALLFIVFAFSLFGGFEIQLPPFLLNLLGSAQGRGGTGGVLLMGSLFSLTTFTCTAPFVGSLLATAATSGHWTRPVLGMVAFSSVLALPFFFLSLFPTKLKSLPRAGSWMNEVKVVMGFIELAAASKFLNGMSQSMFPRTTCLVFCVAVFAAMGLYLLGTFRLPHDSPRERTSVTQLVLSLSALGFAVYLSTGLGGAPLGAFIDGYLPLVEKDKDPQIQQQRLVDHIVRELGGKAVGSARSEIRRVGLERKFEDDYEGGLAEARKLGVPLFIDFTGFT